ncbi:hypothetical protein CSUI_009493 [Cystoisospora suis]|uniref:Uncharacterized protein n=1 Tax=Cystoisospora suis TaxID=483139 RepID=A0A2C6KHU9_9APIC|nr:hypothetical protein CSUI_009493 [Cystoisospora suis]
MRNELMRIAFTGIGRLSRRDLLKLQARVALPIEREEENRGEEREEGDEEGIPPHPGILPSLHRLGFLPKHSRRMMYFRNRLIFGGDPTANSRGLPSKGYYCETQSDCHLEKKSLRQNNNLRRQGGGGEEEGREEEEAEGNERRSEGRRRGGGARRRRWGLTGEGGGGERGLDVFLIKKKEDSYDRLHRRNMIEAVFFPWSSHNLSRPSGTNLIRNSTRRNSSSSRRSSSSRSGAELQESQPHRPHVDAAGDGRGDSDRPCRRHLSPPDSPAPSRRIPMSSFKKNNQTNTVTGGGGSSMAGKTPSAPTSPAIHRRCEPHDVSSTRLSSAKNSRRRSLSPRSASAQQVFKGASSSSSSRKGLHLFSLPQHQEKRHSASSSNRRRGRNSRSSSSTSSQSRRVRRSNSNIHARGRKEEEEVGDSCDAVLSSSFSPFLPQSDGRSGQRGGGGGEEEDKKRKTKAKGETHPNSRRDRRESRSSSSSSIDIPSSYRNHGDINDHSSSSSTARISILGALLVSKIKQRGGGLWMRGRRRSAGGDEEEEEDARESARRFSSSIDIKKEEDVRRITGAHEKE